MKKFIVFSFVSAVLTGPALGADMPVKASPPTLATSWAGFYVGAHVGYGFANTAVSTEFFNPNRIIGIGSKGWAAGGLAGYNFMLSPRWVGGIEVDGSWLDVETRAQPFAFFFNEAELNLRWSASARGRIGFLMTPRTMLYGTAGWSWSKIEFSNTLVPENISRSINGPQAGFGVETMYAPNWLLRTEYLHSFYGDTDFRSDFLGQGNASPWVGIIRTALIYKIAPSNSSSPWPDRTPNTSWQGFYVGGLIGPMVANAKVETSLSGVGVDGVGVTGILPSVLAGYNFQVAPQWIVGLEGEIAPNISTSDVKVEWTGGARVRAGYLVTPTVLAYGTLGWATVGIDDITFSGGSLPSPVERIHGLTYGTGLEAAISDRWRLRADYQFFWSNKVDVVIPDAGGTPTPVIIKATAQAGRVGVVYAFGGP